MVHISKIAKERIKCVEDVLTLGDVVKAKCMGLDKMGRVSFSIKDAMESKGGKDSQGKEGRGKENRRKSSEDKQNSEEN